MDRVRSGSGKSSWPAYSRNLPVTGEMLDKASSVDGYPDEEASPIVEYHLHREHGYSLGDDQVYSDQTETIGLFWFSPFPPFCL